MIGERGRMLEPDVAALPNDVILDEQLAKLLEGLDPEEPVATVQPTKGATWLPDVSFSHVGHAYQLNAWEVWPHVTHTHSGEKKHVSLRHRARTPASCGDSMHARAVVVHVQTVQNVRERSTAPRPAI